MDITLRQLEYFVAVAERLSFRAAAEACFVTQPGLSVQLKELEGQLDVQLFERSRRRSPGYAGGGAVVAPGQGASSPEAGELVETARSLTRPLSATLRLGVIPTVAPYLLPRALPAIRTAASGAAHPAARGLHAPAAGAPGGGEAGSVAAGVGGGPGGRGHPAAGLGSLRGGGARRTPFHRVRRRLAEADLAGEQVLLLDDGHCLRDAGPGGVSERAVPGRWGTSAPAA